MPLLEVTKPATSDTSPSAQPIRMLCRSINTPLSFTLLRTMLWNRRLRMSSPKTASFRSSFVLLKRSELHRLCACAEQPQTR